MRVKYPSPRHRRWQIAKQLLLTIASVTLFVTVIDLMRGTDDACMNRDRAEAQALATTGAQPGGCHG